MPRPQDRAAALAADRNLAPAEGALLQAIAFYEAVEGRCVAKRKALMRRAGIESVETFAAALERLQAFGLVTVDRKRASARTPRRPGERQAIRLAGIEGQVRG